jgi:hypothetical protein
VPERIGARGGHVRIVGEIVDEVKADGGDELGRRDRQAPFARAADEEVEEGIDVRGLHVRIGVEISVPVEVQHGTRPCCQPTVA